MNFLVFHSDPVILLDMIGIMRNTWPNAAVEASMSLADFRKAATNLKEISCAVIGLPVADIEKTGLQDLIEQKQGRIVVSHFGDGTTVEQIAQRGWVPLTMPFTDETVRDALLNAGAELR